MFGKHFAGMYTGSMMGAGAVVFAVMGYVIANAKPSRIYGGCVELNAKLLATVIGEPEEKIREAIAFLCAPDDDSRSHRLGGRRLVQIGAYDYQVVNFEKYRKIKKEEDRREQNRINQQRRRERLSNKPLPGERAYEEALRSGDDKRAQDILDGQAESGLT